MAELIAYFSRADENYFSGTLGSCLWVTQRS